MSYATHKGYKNFLITRKPLFVRNKILKSARSNKDAWISCCISAILDSFINVHKNSTKFILIT